MLCQNGGGMASLFGFYLVEPAVAAKDCQVYTP